MAKAKPDTSIPCWGPQGLWRHGGCDAKMPDDKHTTMRRMGWGWTLGPNSDNPPGNYFACPEHKDPS